MHYFEVLPQEIFDIILLNCDYTEIAILNEEFDINVDYEKLLLTKYPWLHKMVQDTINSIYNNDLTYKKAYDIISVWENFMEIDNPEVDLKSFFGLRDEEFTGEKRYNFFNYTDKVSKMRNLFNNWDRARLKIPNKYIKYKKLLPNIKNINSIFDDASKYLYEPWINETSIFRQMWGGDIGIMDVQLCSIYLFLLDNPPLIRKHVHEIMAYEDIINSSKRYKLSEGVFVIYNYIKKYVIANM